MKKNLQIVIIYVLAFMFVQVAVVVWYLFDPTVLENATANSMINLIYYGVLCLVLVWVMREWFAKYIKDFIANKTFYILGTIAGIVAIYGAVIFAGLIMQWLDISETSNNQAALEEMLSGSIFDKLSLIIFAVLFAPIVEEVVFRKGVYGLFENINEVLAIVVSGLLFGFMHVMSGDFVQLIYYGGLGIALGTIYYFGKKNLLLPIAAHFFVNVIATIGMFLF